MPTIPAQAYNFNLPNPPDDPGDDVAGMQVNTQTISTCWSVDHIPYGTNNNGAHTKVQMPVGSSVNGSLPSPLIGAGFATLYPSLTGTPAADEIWLSRDGNAGIQLTGPGNPSANTNGYTFLPGGLLIQWGSKNNSGSSSVSFSIPFPNNVFNVIVSPFWNGTAPSGSSNFIVRKDTLSTSAFTWLFVGSSSHYDGFFWYAIGN